MPDKISFVVEKWRTQLSAINQKAGQSLADPKDYENLFPGLQDALKTQQYLKNERSQLAPASAAKTMKPNHERNPVSEMRNAENEGKFVYSETLTGVPDDSLEDDKR